MVSVVVKHHVYLFTYRQWRLAISRSLYSKDCLDVYTTFLSCRRRDKTLGHKLGFDLRLECHIVVQRECHIVYVLTIRRYCRVEEHGLVESECRSQFT